MLTLPGNRTASDLVADSIPAGSYSPYTSSASLSLSPFSCSSTSSYSSMPPPQDDSICVLSVNGSVLYIDRQIFGAPSSNVPFQITEIIHPNDIQLFLQSLSAIIGSQFGLQLSLRLKNFAFNDYFIYTGIIRSVQQSEGDHNMQTVIQFMRGSNSEIMGVSGAESEGGSRASSSSGAGEIYAKPGYRRMSQPQIQTQAHYSHTAGHMGVNSPPSPVSSYQNLIVPDAKPRNNSDSSYILTPQTTYDSQPQSWSSYQSGGSLPASQPQHYQHVQSTQSSPPQSSSQPQPQSQSSQKYRKTQKPTSTTEPGRHSTPEAGQPLYPHSQSTINESGAKSITSNHQLHQNQTQNQNNGIRYSSSVPQQQHYYDESSEYYDISNNTANSNHSPYSRYQVSDQQFTPQHQQRPAEMSYADSFLPSASGIGLSIPGYSFPEPGSAPYHIYYSQPNAPTFSSPHSAVDAAYPSRQHLPHSLYAPETGIPGAPSSTMSSIAIDAASALMNVRPKLGQKRSSPTSRPKRRSRPPDGDHKCLECGREESPEWRKGPAGPKTLCNACGLRWAKQNKGK